MGMNIDELTVGQLFELAQQINDKLNSLRQSLPVVHTNGHGRPPRSFQHDYESFDWTKSDVELCAEHNVSFITIRKHRARLGHPKVKRTKWFPACESWDWSKSDTEITREVKGINVYNVRKWRLRLGKPLVPQDYHKDPKPPPNTFGHDLSSVDWKKPDIEISKEVGCTREYVRQFRAKSGIPKSLFKDVHYQRFLDAFKDRTELTHDEVREKLGFAVVTINKYCHKAGIKVIRANYERLHPWRLFNWSLPNIILKDIWGVTSFNGVAARRCNHGKIKPLFRCHKGRVPEQFLAMVQEERDKAKTHLTPHPPLP